ncbi:MAG: ATP-binding protein [Oligoflexales bacterium]|nr:ATP-binding protein [Oligoflexales bacterium]
MSAKASQLESEENQIDDIYGLMESLSDSIVCVSENGKLLWANKKAYELYPIKDLMKAESLELYFVLQKKLSHGPKQWNRQITQFSPDGPKHTLNKLGSQHSLLFQGMFFFKIESADVVDEKTDSGATQDIDQQMKLAVIGELASGVMHDIRNPLSAISSFNNYMLKQAIHNCDIKRMDKCQKGIEKAVTRIQRLSNHLRDFSRAEKEEPEEFLLKEFIDDSLLITKSRIGESGAAVNVAYGPEGLKIIGCSHKLEQVLINLISNACDAVKSRRGARIDITVEEESTTISVVISDNGSGIKEEHLERIFESFFTTKPRGSGTGLGLSMCAGIMSEQGGQIEVESTYGEGTSFRMTLPKDVRSLEGKIDE